MTEDGFPELAALLRAAETPPDESFVADVQWLIDLDLAFAEKRRSFIRGWVIDLGSVLAVGTIGYAIADHAPNSMTALPSIMSLPLLAAAAVAALWLFARTPNLAD